MASYLVTSLIIGLLRCTFIPNLVPQTEDRDIEKVYVDMVESMRNNMSVATRLSTTDFHNVLIAADRLRLYSDDTLFRNLALVYIRSNDILLDSIDESGTVSFEFDGLLSYESYFKLLVSTLFWFDLYVDLRKTTIYITKYSSIVHRQYKEAKVNKIDKVVFSYNFIRNNIFQDDDWLKRRWRIIFWILRNMQVVSIDINEIVIFSDTFKELCKVPLVELRILYYAPFDEWCNPYTHLHMLANHDSALKNSLKILDISNIGQGTQQLTLDTHCISSLLQLSLSQLTINDKGLLSNNLADLLGVKGLVSENYSKSMHSLNIELSDILYVNSTEQFKNAENVAKPLFTSLKCLRIRDVNTNVNELQVLSQSSLLEVHIHANPNVNPVLFNEMLQNIFSRNSYLARSVRIVVLSGVTLTEHSIRVLNTLSLEELALNFCSLSEYVHIAEHGSPLSMSLRTLDLSNSKASKEQIETIFMVSGLVSLIISGKVCEQCVFAEFKVSEKPIRNSLKMLKYNYMKLCRQDMYELAHLGLVELQIIGCDLLGGYIEEFGTESAIIKRTLKTLKFSMSSSMEIRDVEALSEIGLIELSITYYVAVEPGCLRHVIPGSNITKSLKKLKYSFSALLIAGDLLCEEEVEVLSNIGLTDLSISSRNSDFFNKLIPFTLENRAIKSSLRNLQISLRCWPISTNIPFGMFPDVNVSL